MTGRSDSYIRRVILCLLILSGLAVSVYSQDKKISGIVNVYRRVDAIGPGLDNVTLNTVDSISPGDTVMLIQMQGITIQTDENPAYGTSLQDTIGKPGGYEFLLVQSVDAGTKKVVFRNNILNSFSIKGNVQLIRVPYYNAATVIGKLIARSWNSTDKVGGVLSMIVGRKLTLNSDIDVSGSGLNGGQDAIGAGECVSVNSTANFKESYPDTWTNSGNKGEGVATYDASKVLLNPLHSRGMGPNLTGGGGGNGKYAGGGGGGNRGKGGDGGEEINFGPLLCGTPYTSINGASTVKISYILDGLFLGGGGGASTHAVGSTGSSGGNGGGIVIIIADTISGNRNSFKANGAVSGNALGDAGAGGGGGGGSIAISAQSFSNVASDSLKISVKGGDGGINIGNSYGFGGGGGGGLIWFSAPGAASIPAKVPTKLVSGNPGPGTTSEGLGETKYAFSPKLNGFLFNSIRSEVTGNQVDSICSNVSFGTISGTLPVGGKAPHTYLWESSTTSETSGFAPASGVNTNPNYLPGILTQTTWFRRVVTDSNSPALVDFSKPVKVLVQPFIKNNIVGTSDTICFAQDPPAFTSKATLLDGNGTYSFRWQVSQNNILFNLPSNTYNADQYTPPPALKVTSWYRRTVTSGRCVDSTAIVKITVLDTISNNNIISPAQDICFGTTFNNLTATTPPALTGGDNSYRFKWESNINGAGWSTAPGVSNGSGYDPTELSQRVPMNEYNFRRVVLSGSNDVCTKTSASVLLRDYPVITNNTILANQTICSGSAPAIINGSTPQNGNLIYSYSWQDSSKAHTWAIIAGASLINYQAPVLTDTTAYRRIVNSSACTDISKSITVIVHKPLLNNIISLLAGGLTDTTICNGAIPHLLRGTIPTGGTNIPGDYAYLWKFSNDNSSYNAAPGTNTLASYQPPTLVAGTFYYKRLVTSGLCTDITNTPVKITVLPAITNNVISGKATVCYNTVPTLLTGTDPLGGGGAGSYTYSWEQSPDGTTWVPAALVNSTRDYQPPALLVPMKYRRTVKSGASDCCTNVSAVFNISIDLLPAGAITSTADTIICEGSNISLRIHLTGATPWQLIFKENSAQITKPGIAGTDPAILFTPVTGTSLTTFNYSLFEVKDKNNCIATSLAGTRKADVYKTPRANAGPDADTCGTKYNLKAVPSAGTGTWYYPSAAIIPFPNNPSVTVTIDSLFPGANITHKFIWEEVNWQCKSKDSVLVKFDKRVNNIYAGPKPDTTLYSFDNILHMVAHKLNAWETGAWTIVNGTGDFTDVSAPSSAVQNLSPQNTFLWTVTNGTCKNEDQVIVNVSAIEIPQGFSPNGDNINDSLIIRGLDLDHQYAELKILNSAGAEVFSTSNNKSTWTYWTGKNSSGIDLPEGTYYYLLKITSDPLREGNGTFKKWSGFIILKRY